MEAHCTIGENYGIKDYIMLKVKTISSSLRRQTEEGVRILNLEEMDKNSQAVCLNSKLDFAKATVTSVVPHCGSSKEPPSLPLCNWADLNDSNERFEWI